MTRNIPDQLLAELSVFIAARMGLHFPPERWRDLERGIQSAARELEFADAEGCSRRLLASPLTGQQFEILASHLTIGETYFFREQQSLEAFREHVLPALIRARRGKEERLRVWSAGCSTGEEAYSVAILLDSYFPDLKNWRTDIVATDINVRSLRKASTGIYGEWSFRGTPAWVKERYFERRKDGNYEIHPHIKHKVSFSYLNLAEDSYPSPFNDTDAIDVTFCRNVLMYFSAEQSRRVIANISHSLVAGGWLVVSPSELSSAQFSEFAPVNFTDSILYQKKDTEWQAASGGFHREVDAPVASAQFFSESVARREAENLPAFPPEGFASHEAAGHSRAETPPTRYQEARAYYERGHYREATGLLLELVSREPENPQTLVLLARACANLGDLAEALRWCERAAAADKMNASVHFLRATILQEQQQTAEAVKSLRRSLYLEKDFALAHFALGNLARREGKLRESGRHFANALALLEARAQDDILPESEGMSAGHLAEIIRQAMSTEADA